MYQSTLHIYYILFHLGVIYCVILQLLQPQLLNY